MRPFAKLVSLASIMNHRFIESTRIYICKNWKFKSIKINPSDCFFFFFLRFKKIRVCVSDGLVSKNKLHNFSVLSDFSVPVDNHWVLELWIAPY